MKYFAGRLTELLLTLLVVTLLVFLLLEYDARAIAVRVLGPYATGEQLTLWLSANGYDRPIPLRYLDWLGRLLSGDLGESTRYRAPVADILWQRLGNTAILGGLAILTYVAIGIVVGVLAGLKEGSVRDRSLSLLSVVTTSIPEFATAAFLSFIFVFWLKWLPGTSVMSGGFAIEQLVLPVAVLVIYAFGYIARITRASILDVMAQPFVRTAQMKGLPRSRVVLAHVMRNGMITPLTVVFLQFNWLLTGVIVVESFFAYKGFGALILDAALNKDTALLQACTLVAVVMAISTQLMADLGYMLLNPRIRVG
jgi:peptide/nickel transport system permease protein